MGANSWITGFSVFIAALGSLLLLGHFHKALWGDKWLIYVAASLLGAWALSSAFLYFVAS